MRFQEKYLIEAQYLTPGSKRRSGRLTAPGVKFIVAHDTGNPNSTAIGNVRYYQNSRNDVSASAHIFVDDSVILECIPALTDIPEKAWHVLYSVPTDDKLYGFNANDAAIGVEYCYGSAIDADEAYERYVWVMAYICDRFSLDPRTSIVGHFFLDPQRRSDPVTGLAHSRRAYEQFLRDVTEEFIACGGGKLPPLLTTTGIGGTVRTTVRLNIREGRPSTKARARVPPVEPGVELPFVAVVEGETINGNPNWYKDPQGNYFWSGGVV